MDSQKEQQFVEAVKDNRKALWRVAFGILRTEADAEDAVSAAVEKTWRLLERLRSMDALKVYFDRPGKWTLTDEKGAPVFGAEERRVNELYVVYGQYNEAGGQEICCDFQWYGVRENDLPDVISLSWLPDAGDPMIFPVRVR